MTSRSEDNLHSPGPWFVEHRNTVFFSGQRANAICATNKHVPEWEANARLIAAAPDLLTALVRAEQIIAGWEQEMVCDHSVGICWCDDIAALNGVRAAIAKATGEESDGSSK